MAKTGKDSARMRAKTNSEQKRKNSQRNFSTAADTMPFYIHPVFLSGLIFILIFIISFFVLDFYFAVKSTESSKIPNYSTGTDFPEFEKINFVHGKPTLATKIYLQAWDFTGTERLNKFQELRRIHGNSPEWKVSADEFNILVERQKEKLEFIENRKRLDQEKKQRVYQARALREYAVTPRIKDLMVRKAALEKIISKYPNTEAEKKAKEALEKIPADISDIEDKMADATDPKKIHQKESHDLTVEFFNNYHAKLIKWDLNGAKKIALDLANDKKFTELNYIGQGCIKDLQDLDILANTIEKHYKALMGTKAEAKLADGSTINGRVTTVTDKLVRFVIGGRYAQKVIFPENMNLEFALDIYKSGKPAGAPSPDLVAALVFYARDNEFAARSFFNRASKTDPRKGLHQQLLKYSFPNKK